LPSSWRRCWAPACGTRIILGAVYWTRYARVIRGEVLSLREREFVKLAEIAGASRARVILRHILPNVLNSTMVLASLTIGVVINLIVDILYAYIDPRIRLTK